MDWKCLSMVGDRDINEDSVKVIQTGTLSCYVVADGLGGHGKGDVASQLAVEAFSTVFSRESASLSEMMAEAFLLAQDSILKEQQKSGQAYQMKTTVCALAIQNGKVIWGHIGDTRLYAFYRNKIKMRTLDHSVPQMLVLSREIKESEIRRHPDRNKLLRVLGISGEAPRFEVSEAFDISKFQAFLLCSDGFWELVLEKEMCKLLKKSHSAEEWLLEMQKVVELRAVDADMDNSSAIALWV